MRNSAEQQHRVNRAMNFARANLSTDLNLTTLADVACLSKHHFARVFETRFQETPSKFVSRARLELAARKLVFMRNTSITQIALECGFSGSDTFSRSFRARFGCTPRTFRTKDRLVLDSIYQNNSLSLQIQRTCVDISYQEVIGFKVLIERRHE